MALNNTQRTTGRIFILLATVAAAPWPLLNAEPGYRECGLLLVDFEQFFDTLRQARLFHKMQVAGLPDNVIMLWKEANQTHSVKVVFSTTRGESIKILVGVPQGMVPRTCNFICGYRTCSTFARGTIRSFYCIAWWNLCTCAYVCRRLAHSQSIQCRLVGTV